MHDSTNMKCAYEFAIGESDRIGCRNDAIATDGIVPAGFCANCPHMTPSASNNFFAANADLLLKQQRSGKYAPVAKSCGGCGEVKRRDSEAVQFVWPYWHGGACGDEIRWSVRSVETFFQGSASITIIGDRPPWYHGHHIAQKRVSKHTPNRAFRDMLAKMQTMATHREMQPEFVWMMDDIYFIKPVTLEDIETPRAVGWRPSNSNSWQKRKHNTMAALAQAGRTQHDYATHMPHHVEKEKLAAIIDEFNLSENTMLWEVLYGNTFRNHPKPLRPIFQRLVKKVDSERIVMATEKASILNHASCAWNPDLRNYLSALLPVASKTEIESAYSPTFKPQRGPAPTVKRRPKHTHRKFVERQAAGALQ